MPVTFELSDITRMTRLEIKRRHLGWNRAELANRSGVSVQTIKKHETGVRNSYVSQTIAELIGVLGIEQNYLVRGMRDIWEGGGTLWRKDPHHIDRWEEIVVLTPSPRPNRINMPTRSTAWTINYNWFDTTASS